MFEQIQSIIFSRNTFILLLLLAVLSIGAYFILFKPLTIVQNYKAFSILIYVFIIFILVMFLLLNTTSSSVQSGVNESINFFGFLFNLLITIILVAIGVAIILILLKGYSSIPTIADIVTYGLKILLFVGIIAGIIGVYKTLLGENKLGTPILSIDENANTWNSVLLNIFKLFIKLVTYIPCLLLGFVDYIKEQNKITSKPIWILLIIEIIIIMASIYVPYFFEKIINHKTRILIEDPTSLLSNKKVSDIRTLGLIRINGDSSVTQKYSYGISAWFYIHPQPPNTNYQDNGYESIFNFGDIPNVEYNGTENKLRVVMSTQDPNNKQVKFTYDNIKLQNWNNLIINVDKGNLDIFLNSKLLISIPNVIPYTKNENITIGGNVNGEICNFSVVKTALSKSEVMWIYKTFKNLNPPLIKQKGISLI